MYSRAQCFNAQSTVNFSGNGVDSPAEKNGSFSREWVVGRETGPRVLEPAKANSSFNAPNFSRNCSLFVR